MLRSYFKTLEKRTSTYSTGVASERGGARVSDFSSRKKSTRTLRGIGASGVLK